MARPVNDRRNANGHRRRRQNARQPSEPRASNDEVEPLQEAIRSKIATAPLTTGALVKVRAVPGLTAEWLQRIVDCHLARASSLGNVMPEMTNCPLLPKGESARVTPSGSAFAVAIRSDDAAAETEVLRRAQQLVAR